ncbi:MAG: hypothetical protein FWE91_03595 [Defluviitaleaceae bacterium]|nr:hypothetical protein [Defluviitaleaceae bacterium]MCL2835661.1 hypothetical protein [Defluviitaleaceae bacterium]
MINEEKILAVLEKHSAMFERHDTMLETLATTLIEMKSEIDRRFENVEQSLSRIEIEHGESLDVLHDGYKLLFDKAVVIQSDLGNLKGMQDLHEHHIKWLHARRKPSPLT